jgi:hypothetical protein
MLSHHTSLQFVGIAVKSESGDDQILAWTIVTWAAKRALDTEFHAADDDDTNDGECEETPYNLL